VPGSVVNFPDAALYIGAVYGLIQVFLILLLLRGDVGNESFDQLNQVGHGESFSKVV
jgi:hypothetical protein